MPVAATSARPLQAHMRAHPEQAGADHPYAAALTDADLSMHILLEVALLGTFPPALLRRSGDCLKTGPEACWQVDTFSGHLTGAQPPQNNMITSV